MQTDDEKLTAIDILLEPDQMDIWNKPSYSRHDWAWQAGARKP